MDINVRDIITLDDDNEYVVAGKTSYLGETYYYLIRKDCQDIKFCVAKKNTQILTELSDKKLIRFLLPRFIDKSLI